jgi:DNA-3-methyladenine glycosylase
MVEVERIYDSKPEPGQYRVLIDGLWPRGISKSDAKIDLWLKELAPSKELRQWYNHEPEKFSEFRRRYQAELKANKQAINQLKDVIKQHKNICLLFSAKASDISNAAVLRDYLKL